MTIYTDSAVDQTNHFADAFVRENVAYGSDVVAFESLQSTALCLAKFNVRKWIF